MKRLIDSFSIRAAPIFNPGADGIIVENFAIKVQEYHTETANRVVTERFNAGVQLFHVPEGETEAFRSFSVAPRGFDILGQPMPEHEVITTDILRYRANG